METIQKEIIWTDIDRFNKERDRFNLKKDVEKQIKREVHKLTNKAPSREIFKDVLNGLYDLLEKTHKDVNPMKLKGNKLAMLLDIDTRNLVALSDKYNSLKDAKEPSLTTHSYYAETDEEKNKLDFCRSLIEVVESFTYRTGLKTHPLDIQNSFKGVIIFDQRKNKMFPNYRWIKGLRY